MPVWMRPKNPAPAAVEVYEFAIRRFEEHYLGLSVDAIERRDIREHIEWVQAQGKSAKTIDKEHGTVHALLNIARNKEWVTSEARSMPVP